MGPDESTGLTSKFLLIINLQNEEVGDKSSRIKRHQNSVITLLSNPQSKGY